MNLISSIQAEHSKENTLRLTAYIGTDEARFAVLMELFFEGKRIEQQRAAWVVRHCFDRHPHLILPYLGRLVPFLQAKVHDGVLRNSLAMLEGVEIPEHLQGEVFDSCYNFLADPKRPTAIRMFSMQILYNIGQSEPELLEELRLVIEEHYPHSTAGFKSRGRKLLKLIVTIK